jgi:hypothetical protein
VAVNRLLVGHPAARMVWILAFLQENLTASHFLVVRLGEFRVN